MTNRQPGPPTQTSAGLAIAALSVGLLALVLLAVLFVTVEGMLPLGIGGVLGAVAILLGILALNGGQPRGPAITGIVTGALAVVLGIGLLVFALVFVGAIGSGS